jgi:SAM-dependent methyltransferase
VKRCISCGFEFDAPDWRCPACRWQPALSNGTPTFAEDFATQGAGFPPSSFAPLAELEDEHFWFRQRNSLLIWALKKYGVNILSFMEVGCGTGFVLKGIAEAFPSVQLVGSEIYTEGIAFAAERAGARAEFLQMDARQIPYAAEFDAIGAFDVIEHIQEDEAVLQQMRHALKPRGLLLLTVPQHPSLWSAVDERACHVRRYTARELEDKVTHAGFKIIRSTSFVMTLLPLMFVSRLLQRGKNSKRLGTESEIRINPALNRIFEYCLRFEVHLIRLGVALPVGGSRLVVAIKQQAGAE